MHAVSKLVAAEKAFTPVEIDPHTDAFHSSAIRWVTGSVAERSYYISKGNSKIHLPNTLWSHMLCEGDGFTEATISCWQDGYIPGKLLSETAKSGADGIFPPPEQTFFLISGCLMY